MHPTADLPAIINTLALAPYKQACYRIVDFATLTKFDPMMPLYTLGPGINGQGTRQKAVQTLCTLPRILSRRKPSIIVFSAWYWWRTRHITYSQIQLYS